MHVYTNAFNCADTCLRNVSRVLELRVPRDGIENFRDAK